MSGPRLAPHRATAAGAFKELMVDTQPRTLRVSLPHATTPDRNVVSPAEIETAIVWFMTFCALSMIGLQTLVQ